MIFISLYYFVNAGFLCKVFGICKLNLNFLFFLFLSITPFYFLYTKSITSESFYWKNRYLVHYIPAIIILLLSIISINFVKDGSFANLLGFDKVRTASIIIYNLQVVVYSVAMFIILIRHKNKIKHNFSYDNEKNNLNWLKIFLVIFVSFSILDLSVFYFNPFFDLKPFYYVLSNVFFIFLGYFGLRQTEIYSITKSISDSLVKDLSDNEIEEIESTDDERKSNISDTRAKEMFDKIIELIEGDKIYRQQDLSIFDIANTIQINKTYLSYAINKETGSNFSNFINKYRIEESKELLKNQDYDNLTIEAIANQVGFHSKSSFNSWFKKLNGNTPSEYKKMIRSI